MFKIRTLILYLFLLKPRVIFDYTLGLVNKNSELAKIFLEKNLKLSLGQRFYLTPIFILMLAETNLSIKKNDGI